ncbi:Transcription elongation factor SII [Spironucleus salmonicida]|uniref:DNA-directed RNA polymerase I subunit RPA12 n=1 Tax=Spironucleus salmonicida TaxID=348837 RepID=V6LKF9_9EUKA|nr:Transcription elongation factor SII [Spironucleus salmonicida]|eukprot:EST45130.1 Transcription elongation factor SII [Spironucleus salmonicida]
MEYIQLVDNLVADNVESQDALYQLLPLSVTPAIASYELSSPDTKRQKAVDILAKTLALKIEIDSLQNLRMDLQEAQDLSGHLNIALSELFPNAILHESFYYFQPQFQDAAAYRIEQALHARQLNSRDYFDAFLLLETALSHSENSVLRFKALFGINHPVALANAKKSDLEPEYEKNQRAIATEDILASKDLGRYVVETGIKCKKCEKKTVTRQEKQSRSADEATTIFYTCSSCGYKWSVN